MTATHSTATRPGAGAETGTEATGCDAAAVGAHPLLVAWQPFAAPHDSADVAVVAALEEQRRRAECRDGIERPRFRIQDAGLLADQLHYEQRIAERAEVATREHNAHDLFNGLVWLRHPLLKYALNARQVADIANVGAKSRTRGQCALTHFDEAGAIVWLADDALLPVWDAHAWSDLFRQRASAWGHSIAVTVFGHALIEHVWTGRLLPVAKALVVRVDAAALRAQRIGSGALIASWPTAERALADAIREGRLLADPQELRPLPLAGIPHWHPDQAMPRFHHDVPCFQPLREGRCYPPPFAFGTHREPDPPL